VTTDIKLIIGAVIMVIILVLGFGLYHYKNKAAIVGSQLIECQTANQENQKTINSLEQEVKQAVATADKRIQSKEKLVTRIQYIDSLNAGKTNTEIKSKEEDKNATTKTVDSNNSDPLFVELNRMFP
jgi:preprotein translocase subunit SecF